MTKDMTGSSMTQTSMVASTRCLLDYNVLQIYQWTDTELCSHTYCYITHTLPHTVKGTT